MAKFYALEEDDELSKLVDKIADELGLVPSVDFQVVETHKSKDVCKVVKANDFAECVSNREDLVFVVVYTDAFDEVPDETKYMWLRMELEKVSYDYEKGKVNVGCPCVTVPIGIAEQYGNTAIDAAKLAVYTVSQLADKAKEAKAKKKKGKTPEQAE